MDIFKNYSEHKTLVKQAENTPSTPGGRRQRQRQGCFSKYFEHKFVFQHMLKTKPSICFEFSTIKDFKQPSFNKGRKLPAEEWNTASVCNFLAPDCNIRNRYEW
jgi:hypothetical protein